MISFLKTNYFLTQVVNLVLNKDNETRVQCILIPKQLNADC